MAGGRQHGRVGLRAESLSLTDLGVLTKWTNHSPKGGFLQMGVRSKGVENLGQDSVGTSDQGHRPQGAAEPLGRTHGAPEVKGIDCFNLVE